ncbi:MAG TPA: serine/threonine-protein kinase, partial [Thermoanaerobaculia bacterium]|nr:serine/threonine-protein kinase [Thermoanaerobaculia bacterium]
MSATSDEPGRARRAYEIFAAALELKPAERGAFVDGACGGDPALRGEVDRLLAAAEDPPPDGAGALGDRAPHLLAALEEELSAAPPAGTGQRIGPYRLVEVLGRGGMGVVWLAERDDGAFSKRVALKIVPDWEASDDLPRRLRAERQILAGLEHPNIARLLDGGVTAEGVPYLVMEHVEGEPIDAYCEGRDLGVRDRLALVLAVCDAVAAAHRRLVVHRDLKPGNILVTAEGGVKLLDFGIAKLLDEGGDGGPTRTGLHPLTPQFAAPEQLTGGPITTATDVWGLGALLYRLLAGRSPHAAQGTTTQAVMRAICEEDPRPPSRAARQPQLARHLAGDLDAIALRALRREPAERYASVEALADDLRRHLRGLPVAARPPSLAYRARKLARRRPGAVAAAALALGAIVVVVLGLLQQARLAERERLRAEAVTAFFTGVLRQADPDEARGGEITLRQL